MYLLNKKYSNVLNDPFYGVSRNRSNDDMLNVSVEYNCMDDTKFRDTTLAKLLRFMPDKNTEMYSYGWNILSINEIIKRSNDKYTDIAVQYEGMGWVYVLSYINDNQNFYIRSDGGSNDWDRQYNFDKYNSDDYQPKSFDLHSGKIDNLDMNKQYTFDQISEYLSSK